MGTSPCASLGRRHGGRQCWRRTYFTESFLDFQLAWRILSKGIPVVDNQLVRMGKELCGALFRDSTYDRGKPCSANRLSRR